MSAFVHPIGPHDLANFGPLDGSIWDEKGKKKRKEKEISHGH